MKLRWTWIGILIFATASAWSMNVEPLSARFAPTGRESIQTYRITNTQSQPIAVRIRTTTRELQPNGEEVRNPAEEMFLVFPGRLLLQPGQTQAVRVQWRGSSDLPREEAYRIIFEQVAVDDSADATGDSAGVSLSFMYRYVGALYITPPQAEGEVVLSTTTVVSDPGPSGGITELLLEFENRGTAHVVVREPTVVIEGKAPDGTSLRYEIDADALSVLSGINLLAGARLEQPVVVSRPILPSSIEVTPNLNVAR